jgi:hypothetical protein
MCPQICAFSSSPSRAKLAGAPQKVGNGSAFGDTVPSPIRAAPVSIRVGAAAKTILLLAMGLAFLFQAATTAKASIGAWRRGTGEQNRLMVYAKVWPCEQDLKGGPGHSQGEQGGVLSSSYYALGGKGSDINRSEGDASAPQGDVFRPAEELPASPDACAAALGLPRVALLFLTRGPMHHEETWRLWFESGEQLQAAPFPWHFTSAPASRSCQ